MWRMLLVTGLVVPFGGAGGTVARVAADDRVEDGAIRIERDPATLATRVRIRAARGEVAWSDVLRGLARARGYDDTALAGLVPDRKFSLDGPGWLLTATGVNTVLGPGIQFGVEPGAAGDTEPWLVVNVDRGMLLASQRKFKRKLQARFGSILGSRLLQNGGGADRGYGLVFDDDSDKVPARGNLVIFIHGLESSPEAVRGLVALARAEDLACGSFFYPNDQAIADSAVLLARELAMLAKEHAGRGVSLVAHSMGGLIARAVIEDPELDPGNVRQLIMIATPNQGSNLARFGFALDVAGAIADAGRRREIGAFSATIEDGLSEASVDLMPGSLLLRTLNSRGRNPRVAYTLFLGDRGVITEDELDAMKRRLAAEGTRNRWVCFFGSGVNSWLDDLDEVVRGRGDGAVAVERGRLAGVADTLVLSFRHAEVLNTPATGDVKKVHDELLARLKKAADSR